VRDEVKISVGTLDELKKIKDIAAPNCPVRVILTVQKLREGWDCPFAYVLCSLRETRSATAIEQIVGRVLRLPRAQEKRHPDLNCAYVFSVSASLPEVLNELRQALESNGFTAAEAARIIIPVPLGTLPLGAQPRTVLFEPGRELDVDVAQTQVAALGGKVRIDTLKGEVTVFVPLDQNETDALASCVKTPEAKAKVVEMVKLVREAEQAFGGSGETRKPSPYERQLDFIVPLLCVREAGDLFEFESTFLLEQPWKLGDKDATLSADYNPLLRPVGHTGTVDIDQKGKVQTYEINQPPANYFVTTLHQQVLQLGVSDDWSLEMLVAWLDRHIEHHDIPAGESAEFMRKAIRGLMAKYSITDIGTLALDRFRLRDEIETRIEQHRDSERKTAFQMFLLPGAPLEVSDSRALNFKTLLYEPGWLYEGSFQFNKHYFGKPGEFSEITQGGELTEEFKCARFIDALPEVEFWLRNLSRKATSFRLQTSKDWFYPDFVCQLTDGRILVVEYKGKYLYDAPDAEEKRSVGAVWSSRSGGRCLFVMPTEGDFSAIKQLVRPVK